MSVVLLLIDLTLEIDLKSQNEYGQKKNGITIGVESSALLRKKKRKSENRIKILKDANKSSKAKRDW